MTIAYWISETRRAGDLRGWIGWGQTLMDPSYRLLLCQPPQWARLFSWQLTAILLFSGSQLDRSKVWALRRLLGAQGPLASCTSTSIVTSAFTWPLSAMSVFHILSLSGVSVPKLPSFYKEMIILSRVHPSGLITSLKLFSPKWSHLHSFQS